VNLSLKARSKPITVAIVEDDAGVRKRLATMLEQSGDCTCLGEYANAENALAGVPQQVPQVVLVDVNLPGIDGVECVHLLAARMPKVLFMMLTVHEDADTIFEALKAGASGYLLKPVRKEELVQAIRDVVAGGSPITSSIARKVVLSFHRQRATPADEEMNSLSERELAVLEMLSQGFIYKEIAEKLGISLWTVSTYVQRIYKKLHVTGRAEALAKFRKESGR
jgi:DNA-binding NarL/FixJ family response regulator